MWRLDILAAPAAHDLDGRSEKALIMFLSSTVLERSANLGPAFSAPRR